MAVRLYYDHRNLLPLDGGGLRRGCHPPLAPPLKGGELLIENKKNYNSFLKIKDIIYCFFS
jgi:hypothetical protein